MVNFLQEQELQPIFTVLWVGAFYRTLSPSPRANGEPPILLPNSLQIINWTWDSYAKNKLHCKICSVCNEERKRKSSVTSGTAYASALMVSASQHWLARVEQRYLWVTPEGHAWEISQYSRVTVISRLLPLQLWETIYWTVARAGPDYLSLLRR